MKNRSNSFGKTEKDANKKQTKGKKRRRRNSSFVMSTNSLEKQEKEDSERKKIFHEKRKSIFNLKSIFTSSLEDKDQNRELEESFRNHTLGRIKKEKKTARNVHGQKITPKKRKYLLKYVEKNGLKHTTVTILIYKFTGRIKYIYKTPQYTIKKYGELENEEFLALNSEIILMDVSKTKKSYYKPDKFTSNLNMVKLFFHFDENNHKKIQIGYPFAIPSDIEELIVKILKMPNRCKQKQHLKKHH